MENSETVCKQGEISEEFVRLNESKEKLHNRIGVLFDRLQDIISKPAPTTPTGEKKCQGVLSSQLAIGLSDVSATIETDLEKVNEIIDRLEL